MHRSVRSPLDPARVYVFLQARQWSVVIGLVLIGAGITLMAGGTLWRS